LLDVRDGRQELRSADDTRSFDRSLFSRAPVTDGANDVELARRYQSSISLPGSMRVAAIAARNEVLGAIVVSVVIEVVGDHRVIVEALAWHPSDRFRAPRTAMGAASDLVVEN